MNYGMDYQGGDAYGGSGGFSAGGDAYGAASSQGGGGGSQGAKRNYDDQSLIPVTCRMIMTAQTDNGDTNQLKLEDDRKLYHVKLVGAIRSVEENSTNFTYQIEDGTGLVEVKQWLDENGCTALQEITQAANREHQYVKIVGKLKHYDGKQSIVADTVRVLSTGNELAHHFLEVVYSGEKYKNNSTIVQPASPMMGISHTNPASSGGVGFGGSSAGGRTPLMAQGGGSGDAVRDSVLSYMQQHGEASEYGANIGECIRSLPQHNEAAVRAAADNLQAEGMIYSTINEQNFKCAM